MVKLNNYSLYAVAQYCASEDVALFPWTEESHLERCDSLMELCTVSAGRDSNSAWDEQRKPKGITVAATLLPVTILMKPGAEDIHRSWPCKELRWKMELIANQADWRFMKFFMSSWQRFESYFCHVICLRNVGILASKAYYLHITTIVTAVFVFVKTIKFILHNAVTEATVVWNNGYYGKILFYRVHEATYNALL